MVLPGPALSVSALSVSLLLGKGKRQVLSLPECSGPPKLRETKGLRRSKFLGPLFNSSGLTVLID